ncbi:MAG: UDP-N-acetylmuramoyl-L-alanyl-D-glutamate--2,6-diaminopimelate ligase [Patescibacteria group bacterium]
MFNSIKKLFPKNFINFYHWIKAVFAAYYFGFPGNKLKVIGITGTNGKTTTCNLIAKILEEEGYKVGLATTINFQIGRKKWVNETKMTTLSSWETQSLLARMVKAKCRFAILETSSHALVQHRVWGINYDIVGITNITREHLDFHHTMEEYSDAKELLFKKLAKGKLKNKNRKTLIVNLQDSSWRKFIKNKADRKYAFSLSRQSAIKLVKYPSATFISASDISLTPEGSTFIIHTPKYHKKISLKLPGKFNIQNALLATCVARSLKIKLTTIRNALAKIDLIPGRMEKIDLGQNFQVYIDYALTPDSLEKLYKDTIKPITPGRIIAVFGATGDRDRGKRPIMGEIISNHADIVVLTHEDSWTEDPQSIINEIIPGLEKTGKKLNKDYFIIINRKEAIHKALTLAKKNDSVVITGKGAETKMIYPDHTIPWNERRITEELIKEIIQI